MRAKYSAVPIRHQNVGAVDETKADGHLCVPLLHLLQLLEELEVAGHDDGLSGGRYLHGYVQFLLLCRPSFLQSIVGWYQSPVDGQKVDMHGDIEAIILNDLFYTRVYPTCTYMHRACMVS